MKFLVSLICYDVMLVPGIEAIAVVGRTPLLPGTGEGGGLNIHGKYV